MNNFNDLAGKILSGDNAGKLGLEKDKLYKLASSDDGKIVKSMMENDSAVQKAIESGDISQIKSSLGKIMSTESGKNLMKQLSELMK